MWLPLQHVFQDKCLRRILDADHFHVYKQIWLTFLTAGLYDVLITNSFIGCHQSLDGKNCQIWQPKCPNNSAGGKDLDCPNIRGSLCCSERSFKPAWKASSLCHDINKMINRRIFQRNDFVSWLLWSSRKQSSSRSSSSISVSVSWMSALSLSTSGSEQDLK